MPHLPSRACALACALLALTPCAEEPPPLAFQSVITTDPEDPIDFVEVREDGPTVRLAIHLALDGRTVEWDSQSRVPHSVPDNLGEGESLLVSEEGIVLGSRKITLQSAASESSKVEGYVTEVQLLKGIGCNFAEPTALAGACDVRASADAKTILFSLPNGNRTGSSSVEVFSRIGSQLKKSDSYVAEAEGRVQISSDGQVIAQEDGNDLVLRSPQGAELGRAPAGIGFQLGSQEDPAVVLGPDGIQFKPPTTGAAKPPIDVYLGQDRAALGVAIAGEFALVFTRSTLHWIHWPSAKIVWTRRERGSRYASVDARLDCTGRMLLAAGRLDVHEPARRLQNNFGWGSATATVEVMNTAGQLLAIPQTFDAARWKHNSPRVRILTNSRRIVVSTGDQVLLSDAVLAQESGR